MRLKELHLYGFKSFPAKTKIQFGDGITAILGPNGCGKTNIFDALRWVLGEQGFSVLRCGKNEDLIFMGAQDLLPLGYTEVSLILENDGALPDYGAELEIKRRFYKSGESEYLLNRTPCKLRDIQDLFLNSGAGAQAYSVFDQTRQREIVAGEIRPMFEEAAAMAKYRERKHETERKLELTEADLVRLDDIIRERERITRSLRRQARQLDAYNKVKNEFDQIQLSLLKHRYQATLEQSKNLRARLDFIEEEEKRLLSAIARQEKRLQELKGVAKELRDHRDRLVARKERLTYLSRELTRLAVSEKTLLAKLAELKPLRSEKEKALARLLSEAETAQSELARSRTGLRTEEESLALRRQEIVREEETLRAIFTTRDGINQKILSREAQLENRHQYLEQLTAEEAETVRRQNQLREERRGMKQSLDRAVQAITAVERQLAETREQSAAREQECTECRTARAEHEHRLGELRNEIGLLTLKLQEKKPPAFAGGIEPVFEMMTVEPGWEWAVEASLYPFLDYFVVRDGRFDWSAVNRDARFGFVLDGGEQPAAVDYPAGTTRLHEHVAFTRPPPPVIRSILERVVVVKNYEEGARLAATYPHLICTTRDGIARFPNGTVVAEASQSGKLSLRRHLATVNGELANRTAERAALDTRLSLLDQQLKELERQHAADTQELVARLRARSEIEGVLSSVRRAEEETERARNRLLGEIAANRTRSKDLENELAGLKREQEAAQAREADTNRTIAAREAELETSEAAAKKLLAAQNGTLLKIAQLEERIHALEIEIGYLAKDETDVKDQLTAVGAERVRLAADEKTLEGELAQAGAGEVGTQADLAQEEERLEGELGNNRAALDTIREQRLKFQVEWYGIDSERKRQEREATEIYHTPLADFEITFEGDLTERLDILSRRLELLGRANPLAGEDYKREKAELDRLVSQRQDVLHAKEDLTSAIAEIDDRVKDQFVSTFSAVRTAFQELFVEIFGAGEADLVLADPANIWESDVEIVARPRGKNLKRLEQLSDGEKALLAICLLFAFYKVRPAPFCFIDEIDAPLDDANVKRFSEFLKQLSAHTQIVIITHNRVTVEHADVLFGVTMEKPGVSKIVSVRLKDFKDALVSPGA